MTDHRKRVADELKQAIDERTEKGRKEYGEPLTTHNGRDPSDDAWQEAIDLIQYQRQQIIELRDDRSESAIKAEAYQHASELANSYMEFLQDNGDDHGAAVADAASHLILPWAKKHESEAKGAS